MLPTKNYPRQRVDQIISARSLNNIMARLDRLERMGSAAPIGTKQTPGGSSLTWTGPLVDVRYFLPKSGPIPAATGSLSDGTLTLGSGKATRYYRDRKSNLFKPTKKSPVTVYNPFPFAVGDTSQLIACVQNEGDWMVLIDACPEP